MGNCTSSRAVDASVSTKGWKVVVDHDIDYVDSKTGKRKIGELDLHAVHGIISAYDLEAHENMGSPGCCGGARPSGHNALANRIVKAALHMAHTVAHEADVMSNLWPGPAGKSILEILLGEADEARQVPLIQKLAICLKGVVAREPIVNYVSAPAKVYGDLHGQFRDLLLYLHHYGNPAPGGPNFIFNGDWVDRGAHQVETIVVIYALKLAFPNLVWLNRGNHEDETQNKFMGSHGFEKACLERFGHDKGRDVFSCITWSFEYLPLATVIGESILVVHGGIGDGQWQISQLLSVQRPLKHHDLSSNRWVYNLLWSDPVDEDHLDGFGVHDSPRDNHKHLVMTFGVDVSTEFLKKNGLGMIVRSHEAKTNGYGYEVMHGEHLVRVFSARDYGNGHSKNDGSILSITLSSHQLLITPQVLQSLTKDRTQTT
mmetsp:Transcript_63346/g.151137  ORF Transcript_63346/g.151137 Transcript_63346/m.151137 type:complete len:429 (+) Transcript_63346:89-1375(+)|eukprot:CAMPEP_0178422958 /NCGR_PEP_ID=MMETSP0689_2-20121128/27443_1 /TAXON_ID=160604 /ORGANISM="Amphidinium massartii, Strain CS-259" /LENGTH=428 /DNA_ID=CAMNT_0020044541 /DNA_START=13 /DNA_END=1299 /DNA_ORIENTATION=-